MDKKNVTCRNGPTCYHLAQGSCKFKHPPSLPSHSSHPSPSLSLIGSSLPSYIKIGKPKIDHTPQRNPPPINTEQLTAHFSLHSLEEKQIENEKCCINCHSPAHKHSKYCIKCVVNQSYKDVKPMLVCCVCYYQMI